MKISLVLALLGLALTVAVVVSLGQGPLHASPGDLLSAVFGNGTSDADLALTLRGPRVLTAVLVGGGLAAAGAAFQILFRNPLVAPDILGVSSGAGLGAAIALLTGASVVVLQASAFAGGLVAAGVAVGCAGLARAADPRLSLVLCGIVTGALASAGLALVVVLAEPYSQLPAITYWLLGAFTRATGTEVAVAAPLVAVGVAVLLWMGFRLDALSLGEEQARSLGLPAPALRMIAISAASLVTSASVALAGVVGWLGLLAPHCARLLVGSTASRLVPTSVLIGALFALGVDRLSTAFGPSELPIGLLTAACGAPAFLALYVFGSRRRG